MDRNASLADTFEKVRSGVFHIVFLSDQNQITASGTGFRSGDFLVTNNHVFDGPPSENVVLRQFNSSKCNWADDVTIKYSRWRQLSEYGGCFVSGSPKENYDFAILSVPEILKLNAHSFSFGDPENLRVGDEVALLGYPFESFDLMCHRGHVSCLENRVIQNVSDLMNVINLDATVNVNNSGGPLIDIYTGRVFGIVTRKATGLTSAFDQLESILRQNILTINSAYQPQPGVFVSSRIAGIDPLQAFSSSQESLLSLAREIRRSANVGIGYAFSIKYVADALKNEEN